MKSIFFNQRRLFMKTKAKGFLLTASVCLAMAFTFSCEDKEAKKAAEAAAAAAVLSAQTAETPKKDDGSVDFEKLTLKGDVYYLNNVPFTGKARKSIYDDLNGGDGEAKYEMKDGKFHGKYISELPNATITGTYKEGKQHGEWVHEGGDTDMGSYNAIEHYKDGKKDGEWKFFKSKGGQLYKTETWKNDKLIKEWKKEDEKAKNEEAKMIDFGKLVLKGDVYYLKNKPFTGKARKDEDCCTETWEMKDGKFHGKYEGEIRPNVNIIGTYKEGKKHGKWEEVTSPVEDEGFSTVTQHYKDGVLISK